MGGYWNKKKTSFKHLLWGVYSTWTAYRKVSHKSDLCSAYTKMRLLLVYASYLSACTLVFQQ